MFEDWLLVLIIFLVSGAALLVALAALLLARRAWRRALQKQGSLTMVKIQSAIMFDRHRYLENFAKIEVTHIGEVPLVIRQIALMLPDGQVIDSVEWDQRNTTLPVTLENGQTAFFYMHDRAIRAALIEAKRAGECELTPICRDRMGLVYKGIPWILPPDDPTAA